MHSAKAVKLMLSGIFLVLVSIFIMVMMILIWSDTSIANNATGLHVILIFAPFISGVVLFIRGLITKS